VSKDIIRMFPSEPPDPDAMLDIEAPGTQVLVDMRARDRFGLAKYGVRIQPCNGRDNLVDAYQEMLDGAVYLRSALYEMEAGADRALLQGMYEHSLGLLMRLRAVLWERDGE